MINVWRIALLGHGLGANDALRVLYDKLAEEEHAHGFLHPVVGVRVWLDWLGDERGGYFVLCVDDFTDRWIGVEKTILHLHALPSEGIWTYAGLAVDRLELALQPGVMEFQL